VAVKILITKIPPKKVKMKTLIFILQYFKKFLSI